MEWYTKDITKIEESLNVLHTEGLNTEQVNKRQKISGLNRIASYERPSLLIIFIKQFQDFMVIILLAATLIAGLLGEYIDALAIMVIVLINGFIGFFQEQRAEKSLDKLQQLSAPTIRVLRNGKWQTVDAEQAVVGDIVRIKTGDRIPADLRLIKVNNLETEESALTGESLPVRKRTRTIKEKNLSLQDQLNMAFKSTLVTKGKGLGIVVNTGMNTAIGQIATLIGETKQVSTPLEIRLRELGKILIYIIFILTALTVFIGVFHGQPLYDMFLAGVSLAVAVIPEGLPAIVTVALSLGVQRMIKRKAIVRKLSAVETLGSATVICTDKTGTITENKMTVQEIVVANERVIVTGEGDSPVGSFLLPNRHSIKRFTALNDLLLYGALCNEATLQVKQGSFTIHGDPTDGALLVAARKYGFTYKMEDVYAKTQEIPFDSYRKRVTTLIEKNQREKILIVKGAPEVLLPKCIKERTKEGVDRTIDREQILNHIDQMASKGLRIIAVGMKKINVLEDDDIHHHENSLTFIGLFGLKDPPRPNVQQSIVQCREAGIKTVMITGDHKKTAIAIANEIGLLKDKDLIVEGHQLNEMTFGELVQIIERISIFARVTPEHKMKIVKAFQVKGHVVAMTGDGVNDAPAIKASDIGISMGISGTDVTKEASSLILLDDNFNTIKEAIREGRNIYENIRKFIRYLLASNVGEIFVMFVAMLLALPLPLVPVQILWVNLITDGLPAMALGLDPPETNVMKQKPRDRNESIFARGLGKKIITRGLLIGLISLIAFLFIYNKYPDDLNYARSVAFTTLVTAQLIHVFDCRSERGLFSRNPFDNIFLLMSVASSFLLLLIVIYIEPLQPIFHTTALHIHDWFLILSLSFIPTIAFIFPKVQEK